jgi:hypothetical protein
MSARAAAWLAWSLCALSFALAAAGVVLFFQSGHTITEPSTDHGGIPLLTVDTLVGSVIGALIAARRPSNPIGWLTLFGSMTEAGGLNGLGYGYAYDAIEGPVGPLPAAAWLAWFSTASENPGLIAAILAFLLFPTGRPPSRGWWPIVCLTVGLGALISLAVALQPGPLANFPAINNPISLPGGAGELATAVSELLYRHGVPPMLLAVAAAALLTRFFRARGVERQQLKWVVYAVTLFPVVFGIMLIFTRLFPEPPSEPLAAQILTWVGMVAFGLPRSFISISVGIAILRHRLFDMDLIIHRTLVYGGLTAVLAALYWVSVVVLQQALRPLTQGSDLAIVGSTLAVAALFQPLRVRIQHIVDRRFYRQRYDASQVLQIFSQRLRDEIDLDSLRVELLGAVERTVQPAGASLWLPAKAERRVSR